MSDDTSTLEVWIGVIGAAAIIGLGCWFSSMACNNRWEASGMKSSWGPMKGCVVQRKDGTWIPEKAYRQIGD